MKQFALLTAGLVILAAQPASAAVTQITTPDLAYTSGTTLLAITGGDFTPISGLTDGIVSLTFDAGEVRSVSGSWSTWGSPPDTEGANPKIVYTGGLTTITFQSDKVLSVFGFEAEPNPFSAHNFQIDYYLGGVLQGTVNRVANGSAGARLMAASGTFDKAVVSSTTNFAFGQVRYDVSAVPEPATWAMMIIGFGAVGGAVRNQRRRQALAFA
ncbi:PEPxxWA-CTERM sorting domain-containing protein [Phenylobacterium sp. LH3H17]|uniref:PEPxxWA-CTERM sorting domain-containing protein n=1 Tax=Phenylobacterium sp. LH3H17 TaxID=2903901 RepID=UPI0020C9D63C|nr:PEPxxWA-CTERM sorting domain-containing protein [Phenylobacterium sp. LH3H17]UTP41432.1 PEPxxWA-CTERM sorting domain-containing protein [Phenylobacterium sp. LH3H17]